MGCMSATSQREVAISYSGAKDKKPVPMVLEIRVGAVDRGACIKDFSQYPQEREFVFVPCSFVEQDGPQYIEATKDGVVMNIPVRVNANLKTATIEEHIGQQKEMHLSAFRYLIDEVEHTLYEEQMVERVSHRLKFDKTGANFKPQEFLSRIVSQCKTVLARHEAVSNMEFISALKYRKLLMEMVDVRMMALSKVEEWLENNSSSYISYRFNAELRTVHRRRLTFLAQQLSSEKSESRKEKLALDLCKAKNLIIDNISEQNDLGESQLMVAAAEGRSADDLRLLAAAKADVSGSRTDGVCAVWLAAQFGNVHCVETLVDLRASVDQASKDGTTPVSIASQMGNTDCVQKLLDLRADVLKHNIKGLSPMNQAEMNSHPEVVSLLKKAVAAQGNGQEGSVYLMSDLITYNKKTTPLIISTGDISDVDGLFALAEYCKTGADVIFIMNYPAYLGVSQNDVDPNYADTNPGLGYKYSLDDVLKQDVDQSKWPSGYAELRQNYGDFSSSHQVKAALTDVAFEIVSRVWKEGSADRGKLFFCIGGTNCINPFSASAIKNELLVYAPLVSKPNIKVPAVEGVIYSTEEVSPNGSALICKQKLAEYSNVYIDFNGPMSFFDEAWQIQLLELSMAGKIKGAFIMGGVLAWEPPVTMPSVVGKLNRFSSATMNQLYHPKRAADFFAMLQSHKIPSFIIVNNSVCQLATNEERPDHNASTLVGVDQFLSSNALVGAFLRQLASTHYLSKYRPAQKPYDYYTAVALTTYLRNPGELLGSKRLLFYSEVYGLALVGNFTLWDDTLAAFKSNMDLSVKEEDLQLERSKKESFRRELEIMSKLTLESISVQYVSFAPNEPSRGYKIELGTCPQ